MSAMRAITLRVRQLQSGRWVVDEMDGGEPIESFAFDGSVSQLTKRIGLFFWQRHRTVPWHCRHKPETAQEDV